jgi:hypothetical protein
MVDTVNSLEVLVGASPISYFLSSMHGVHTTQEKFHWILTDKALDRPFHCFKIYRFHSVSFFLSIFGKVKVELINISSHKFDILT